MTETAVNANDVLMGGSGAPSAKFDEPGTTYNGRIIHPPQAYQEREYNKLTQRSDGKPLVFPSGDPIMSISVDIKTTLRDATIEDDDGTRRLYIQGKRIKEAVRNAVREAGARGLEVGGDITVTFTHREDPMDKGSAKHWTCFYVPAASASLMQETPAVVSAPAPVAAPTAAPASASVAPTPGQPTPEQRAALIATGGIDLLKAVFPQYTGS